MFDAAVFLNDEAALDELTDVFVGRKVYLFLKKIEFIITCLGFCLFGIYSFW